MKKAPPNSLVTFQNLTITIWVGPFFIAKTGVKIDIQ